MIEKSIPRITDWHHEDCRMMTSGDHEGRIFLFHSHTNNGFFFLHNTNYKYRILYWKEHEKGFQKVLNSLRCNMVTSFYHNGNVTDQRAGDVRLFAFLISKFSLGLVRVSHELKRRKSRSDVREYFFPF